MFLTRSRALALAAMAVVVTVLAWAYLRFNDGYAVDDSYITFRYALNALHGDGVSFNPGERYYGSTATGYALILAVLAWAGELVSWSAATIPAISTALSALAMGMLCYSTFYVSTRGSIRGSVVQVAAWAAFSALVFISPLASAVSSHETYFYVGLLAVAACLAFGGDSLIAAACVLVVATTVRPDSALFALILFFAQFLYAGRFERTRREDYRNLAIAVAVYLIGFVVWIGWTRVYYGTFFPGTMDAKKAQVQLGYFPLFNFHNFALSMTSLFRGGYWRAIAWLAILLLVVRVRFSRIFPYVVLPRSPSYRYGLVWLVFGIGLFCAYSVFTVTLWEWYVVPIGLAFVVALAASTHSLFVEAEKRDFGPQAVPVVLAASLLLVVTAIVTVGGWTKVKPTAETFARSRHVNSHLTSYDAIAQYLRAQDPHGTTIAMAEPGTFAYKLGNEFRVYDVLGLASPGVAKALRAGDLDYPMNRWHPKYVILTWEGRFNPPDRPHFFEKYELVGVFEDPYWTATIKRGAYLFRRLDESRVSTDPTGARRPEFPKALTYSFESEMPDSVRTPTDIDCHFETVDDKPVKAGERVVVSPESVLTISGWTVGPNQRPLGDIFVTFRSANGQKPMLARALLRHDRADRGAALKQWDIRFSAGFSLNLAPGVLAPGSYDVGLEGSTQGRDALCNATFGVDVK